jgi:hypothetical protein
MDIWYSSWKFGIFFPALVFCTKKNLATLLETGKKSASIQVDRFDKTKDENKSKLSKLAY